MHDHDRAGQGLSDRVTGGVAPPTTGLSNGAVARTLSVQRFGESLPYVGPLAQYLNPANQAARLLFDGLTPAQESLLNGIFGNALATSIIRINYNSEIAAAGDTPRTVGNIINVPGPSITEDTLVHEAAHVWQHQNSVPFMYAVSALSSQALAAIVTGDRNNAYEYTNLEKYHIPWRYWNAEQQAYWIEKNKKLPDGWWLDALQPPDDVEVPFG